MPVSARSGPRNPIVGGSIAAGAIIVLLLAALLVPGFAFHARTNEYTAEFENAVGLTVDTPVEVAGVPAGRVTDLQLAGDRVRVTFRLDDEQDLGTATRAAIKLRTALGTRFVQVQPAGPGTIDSTTPIPVQRTSVPYNLDDVGNRAVSTQEQLDVDGLRRMVDTLDDVAPEDGQLTGQALDGISSASQVLGKRQGQIQQLLDGTRTLTDSLLSQQDSLTSILGDARMLADVLNERRGVLRQLITDVHEITVQLDTLLADNEDVIGPLLDDLHEITDSLQRNDEAIGESLRQLGPASRHIANASGNGPWGDVSAPLGPIPDNVLCGAGLLEGCGL
ncbi:MCE family protein [Saccharopolyspora sp. HNM0983]|uniref:MCE family protein n=1 Tax=Saccharopolyspora montiporae TaxID=2781240 RepID=A0A929BA21_9PSEU|nr:MCE family protein [Saccharopolyspora sp. HNM0983]